MNKTGPIIVIEDDVEDKELLTDIFKELKVENEIIFFIDSDLALEYLTLTDVEPFLILSDIEMPKIKWAGIKRENSHQRRPKDEVYTLSFLINMG